MAISADGWSMWVKSFVQSNVSRVRVRLRSQPVFTFGFGESREPEKRFRTENAERSGVLFRGTIVEGLEGFVGLDVVVTSILSKVEATYASGRKSNVRYEYLVSGVLKARYFGDCEAPGFYHVEAKEIWECIMSTISGDAGVDKSR